MRRRGKRGRGEEGRRGREWKSGVDWMRKGGLEICDKSLGGVCAGWLSYVFVPGLIEGEGWMFRVSHILHFSYPAFFAFRIFHILLFSYSALFTFYVSCIFLWVGVVGVVGELVGVNGKCVTTMGKTDVVG